VIKAAQGELPVLPENVELALKNTSHKSKEREREREKEKDRRQQKKYDDFARLIPLMTKLEWFEKSPSCTRTLPGI
jgi:hypothetical protein